MRLFPDRIHRLPRYWSNRELKKYCHLFEGHVVNVSGWKDEDKEGGYYKDYFSNASSYTITNYKEEARGYQGMEGEVFLNLVGELPSNLVHRFDVVFSHTVLEHIYFIHEAFRNLCSMSRDVVILVIPFVQQYHSDYGDYWRFSPLAVKVMFEENGFTPLYQSFNSHKMSSIYIFTIASRHPDRWEHHFNWTFSCADPKGRGLEPYIGCHAFPNLGCRIRVFLHRLLRNGKGKL